jgi:hypothetical protein
MNKTSVPFLAERFRKIAKDEAAKFFFFLESLRSNCNYLLKRRQKVINKNSWSSFEPVSAGVPQRSVLGPLMFLIYINDIREKLISLSRLFADDTSLGYSDDCKHVYKLFVLLIYLHNLLKISGDNWRVGMCHPF